MTTCFICGKVLPGTMCPGEYVICRECENEFKRPRTLTQEQKKLVENYLKTVNNPSVYSPLAYALYHTWREVDAQEEKRRKAHDKRGEDSSKA